MPDETLAALLGYVPGSTGPLRHMTIMSQQDSNFPPLRAASESEHTGDWDFSAIAPAALGTSASGLPSSSSQSSSSNTAASFSIPPTTSLALFSEQAQHHPVPTHAPFSQNNGVFSQAFAPPLSTDQGLDDILNNTLALGNSDRRFDTPPPADYRPGTPASPNQALARFANPTGPSSDNVGAYYDSGEAYDFGDLAGATMPESGREAAIDPVAPVAAVMDAASGQPAPIDYFDMLDSELSREIKTMYNAMITEAKESQDVAYPKAEKAVVGIVLPQIDLARKPFPTTEYVQGLRASRGLHELVETIVSTAQTGLKAKRVAERLARQKGWVKKIPNQLIFPVKHGAYDGVMAYQKVQNDRFVYSAFWSSAGGTAVGPVNIVEFFENFIKGFIGEVTRSDEAHPLIRLIENTGTKTLFGKPVYPKKKPDHCKQVPLDVSVIRAPVNTLSVARYLAHTPLERLSPDYSVPEEEKKQDS
jgi:hypothetical protein